MTQRRWRVLGIGSDIGLAVVLQGAGAVVNFAYQTALLRSLSKESAGIYFLAIAYVTLASGLADFGLASTVTPRVAVARSQPTPAYRAALHLRVLALLAGIISLNIYLLVVGETEILPFVDIAYISIVVSARTTGVRQLVELLWRLRGRTYVMSALAVFDGLLGLAALLVLQHHDALNLLSAVLVLGLSSLPGFLIVGFPLWRELRANPVRRRRLPRSLYRGLVAATLPIAGLAVIGQFAGQLETLVLAATSINIGDIAAYNAAVRPLTALIFLSTTFASGLTPLVAQCYKRVRSDVTFEFLASVGVRVLGFISIVLGSVCWLFADQLMSIFGKEYIGEAYILQLYSLVNGLVFIVVLFDQFMIATDRRRQTLIGACLQLSVAIALEVVAIALYGIRGMIAAKALSLLILLVFQLTRFDTSIRWSALRGLARLLPTIGSVMVVSELSGGLPPILRGVFAALAIGLVAWLVPAIRWAELRRLRAIRVTA